MKKKIHNPKSQKVMPSLKQLYKRVRRDLLRTLNLVLSWFREQWHKPLQTSNEKESKEFSLWLGKPLHEHSILLWDYENVSINHMQTIMQKAKYTPHKRYMVTKRTIPPFKQEVIEAMGFTILGKKPFKGSADEKIMHLIRMHSLYSHLMLITSDSDFVPSVHRHLKKGYVHWIMQDSKKKRILMYVNLAHPRLTLSTF